MKNGAKGNAEEIASGNVRSIIVESTAREYRIGVIVSKSRPSKQR